MSWPATNLVGQSRIESRAERLALPIGLIKISGAQRQECSTQRARGEFANDGCAGNNDMKSISKNPTDPNIAIYAGDRGQAYFQQRAHARLPESQRRRASHFLDVAAYDRVILDFGCGTGGLLAGLPAQKRLGVEISPDAIAAARSVLDHVFTDLSEVDDASVDVLISFHAIEHVTDPWNTLMEIKRVLAPGGIFKFFIPYEFSSLRRGFRDWKPGDMDMHLFAWTPLTFGNLCSHAGLEVEYCKVYPMARAERFENYPGGKSISTILSWTKAVLNKRLQIGVQGRVI